MLCCELCLRKISILVDGLREFCYDKLPYGIRWINDLDGLSLFRPSPGQKGTGTRYDTGESTVSVMPPSVSILTSLSNLSHVVWLVPTQMLQAVLDNEPHVMIIYTTKVDIHILTLYAKLYNTSQNTTIRV